MRRTLRRSSGAAWPTSTSKPLVACSSRARCPLQRPGRQTHRCPRRRSHQWKTPHGPCACSCQPSRRCWRPRPCRAARHGRRHRRGELGPPKEMKRAALRPPLHPTAPSLSGGKGDRTPDLRAASAMLSQLSYTPVRCEPCDGFGRRQCGGCLAAARGHVKHEVQGRDNHGPRPLRGRVGAQHDAPEPRRPTPSFSDFLPPFFPPTFARQSHGPR